MAQRDGIRLGKICGPSLVSGKAGGQTSDTSAMGGGREARSIKSPEEGREMVRWKKDGTRSNQNRRVSSGETLKAVVDEAHSLGFAAIAHSMDVFASAEAGVNAVEHHSSIGLTSISDPEKESQAHRRSLARKTRYGGIDLLL
jgi:hypothetical protein